MLWLQACLLKSLDSNTSRGDFLRHPSEQISSPQGNLCMGAMPMLRRILQSRCHLPIPRPSWTQTHIRPQPRESPFQHSRPDCSRRAIKTQLSCCWEKIGMRGRIPWHRSSNGALESFHMGCPAAAQQVSIVQQKESLNGASHNFQRGKTSMALRFRSIHEGAVMHRNSNLSQSLILAVTSDA